MVISFEEKDRAKIEAKGMNIMEYKRTLYRIYGKKITNDVIVLVDIVNKVYEAVTLLSETIIKVVDNVKFLVEEISEYYCRPTSFRYKAVKFISKCTGIEKRRLWTMTRRTWLARSCC